MHCWSATEGEWATSHYLHRPFHLTLSTRGLNSFESAGVILATSSFSFLIMYFTPCSRSLIKMGVAAGVEAEESSVAIVVEFAFLS